MAASETERQLAEVTRRDRTVALGKTEMFVRLGAPASPYRTRIQQPDRADDDHPLAPG
jgi:hypothetical protein